MILALVLAIVAVGLIGLYAVIDTLAGPDPDLNRDDLPLCPGCGVRGCVNLHPARQWVDRQR